MLIGGAALLLVGCVQDRAPLGPESTGVPDVQAALDCRVNVQSGSLSCVSHAPEFSGGASGVIVGGQGENIYLEAISTSVDGQNFTAEVVVKNLLNQTLGTRDGQTPHADGVRAFFTYQGIGAEVDPDGIGVFNRSEQPYFLYDQMIGPGQTSLPKTWRWVLEPGTTEFEFRVYVAGKVPAVNQLAGQMFADAKTVGVGAFHSCGITASGKAYCWGDNSNGRLGINNSSASTFTPTLVVDSSDVPVEFLSLSAGASHSCGVGKDYKLYCWGHGGSGKLGNGSSANNYIFAKSIADTLSFHAVSAGNNHTCGIGTDGTAYCWGFGTSGQLGDGTSSHQYSPVAVAIAKKFISISAATHHSCGVTTDSTAYCWGQGNDGKLGAGNTSHYNTPNPVDVSLLPPGTKFVSINTGLSHTCAVAADGTAYCWGSNLNGALGIGVDATTTPSLNRPQIPVAGGLKFRTVVAGSFEQTTDNYSCGITLDGTAYCWGANGYGQLGNGTTTSSNAPVAVDTGEKFTAIDIGTKHTCATSVNGRVYCWGANTKQELGIGTEGQLAPITPVQTVTNFVWQDGRSRRKDEPAFTPRWSTFEAYAYAGRVGTLADRG